MFIKPGITACIYTVGEPTFKACLESVKAQTLPVERIEVIRNVAPLFKAMNEGIRRVNTDYYIHVDADMILYKDCVETLFNVIKDRERVFGVMGKLKDPLCGEIYGIKMFKTSIMKNMEYKDIIGCDRVLVMEAVEAGFTMLKIDKVLGIHKPKYTPSIAYDRFKRMTEKIRVFSGVEEWTKNLDEILRKYLELKDMTTLFAVIGYISGLFTDLKEVIGEKDFRRVRNGPVLQALFKFFESKAKDCDKAKVKAEYAKKVSE